MKFDPVELWGKLGKNGKIAFVIGMAALTGYYLYRKHQQSVAAAAAPNASQTSDTTSGTGTSDNAGTSTDSSTYQQGYTDAEDQLGGSMTDPYGGYGSQGAIGGYGGYSGDPSVTNPNPTQTDPTADVLAGVAVGEELSNGMNNTPATQPSAAAATTGGGVHKGSTTRAHTITRTKKPAVTHTKTVGKKPGTTKRKGP